MTSRIIPELAWRAFQQSWRTHNPAWEVMFWTDARARTFVATEYRWFLETYDAYPAPVMRADALRYFLLAHYGGVYADMDYECLRPLDEILRGRELILVREPDEHARIAEVRESGLGWLLSNALMASVPGHAFWQHVVERLKDARGNGTPLSATGPIFLTREWESFGGGGPAHVLDAELLCPMTQTESRMGRWRDPAFREAVARRAWAVHHWSNTWVPNTPAPEPSPFRPLDRLPVHLLINRRVVMTGELRSDVPGEAEAPTQGPRISCLMITRERTGQAMDAVRCFRKPDHGHNFVANFGDRSTMVAIRCPWKTRSAFWETAISGLSASSRARCRSGHCAIWRLRRRGGSMLRNGTTTISRTRAGWNCR